MIKNYKARVVFYMLLNVIKLQISHLANTPVGRGGIPAAPPQLRLPQMMGPPPDKFPRENSESFSF